MPHPCCVPMCRGNYKNTKKVSVFGFPRNAELKKKWLRAIKRENFEPTKHSKVCEEHFLESDIQRSASAYDEKKGKLIEAPLKFPRLLAGVVPSVLPNLPAHFSSGINFRESPDARKERKEMSALKVAIDESIKTKEDYNNARGFFSFQEFLEKSNLISESKRTEIKTENQIAFLLIDIEPVPKEEKSDEPDIEIISDSSSPKSISPSKRKSRNLNGIRNCSDVEKNIDVEDIEKTRKKRKVDCSSPPENMMEMPSVFAQNNFDREDIFGHYVVSELRALRDNPLLYLQTKQSILEILTSAHLEYLNPE